MDYKEQSKQEIRTFLQQYQDGVVVIWGATATGKTSLSVYLSEDIPMEVISADSRQIYTHMNIGTDKISKDIREKLPHHMIDIVDPTETFTAGQWMSHTEQLIPEIHTRGNLPAIVGGTGLYIDTIYKNFSMPEVAPDMNRRKQMEEKEEIQPGRLHQQLIRVDPDEAYKHHPNSTRYILRALEIFEKTGTPKSILAQQHPVKRPLLMLGLRRDKESTNKLINTRIKEMFNIGLIEEIQGLLNQGYTLEHTAMNGIGYKEIVGYLQGEYDLEKAKEILKRNTHRYAKRQRSRFRRYIAEGKQTPKDNVVYRVFEL